MRFGRVFTDGIIGCAVWCEHIQYRLVIFARAKHHLVIYCTEGNPVFGVKYRIDKTLYSALDSVFAARVMIIRNKNKPSARVL